MSQRSTRPQLKFQWRLLKNFSWWEPAYIVDWSAVGIVFVLSLFSHSASPFERTFELGDTSIKHTFARDERVPGHLLYFMALYVPLFISGILGALKGSSHNLHHAVLVLLSSHVLTNLCTDWLKSAIGRLRPDFLSRCSWDIILTTCTGPKDVVLDGRRSFPSGHSSMAFAGLGFLSLLLAGQLGSFCLGVPPRSRSFLGSKLARLLITFVPLGFATWIAVTRLEDYRHHKEDVIVGSLLGFTIAFACYIIYWPNPFSSSAFAHMHRPKLLYRAEISPAPSDNPRENGFELAPMVEEQGDVPIRTNADHHDEEARHVIGDDQV